jgi:hypothetical protein
MSKVSKAEFEKLKAEQVKVTRMLCAREFERMIADGEPEIAAARGIDYQDAWTVCLKRTARTLSPRGECRWLKLTRAASRRTRSG